MKHTISIKENRHFRRLYAKGKRIVTPYLVVYFQKSRDNKNHLGITVSKKVGNAVVRNRVRRQIKEIYRTNEDLFCTGYYIVVVARGRAVGASYQKMKHALLSECKKKQLLCDLEDIQ